MNKLFLLTLTWNGKEKLEKLYHSLLPSLQNINYLWLIRDNGSKDNTVELVQGWQKENDNIKLLAHPDNRSNFAEGMNSLFDLSSPADNDLVMLLNNDIVFNDTKSITKMIDLINNDPTVGVVGARLLYTNTNKLQHGGVIFIPNHNTPIHFRAGQVSDKNAEKNRIFQALTGAVLLTKAEYYRKANPQGMDTKYQWMFEDIDLCLSIKKMGKKIVYCGETNIFHEESATLKKNPVNKLFFNQTLQYFLTKWKGQYQIDNLFYNDPKYGLYNK